MRWFGKSWGAPMCEPGQQVPTPIGEACYVCDEKIADGDCGFVMPYLRANGESGVLPAHRGCGLLPIAGHSYGLCACTEFEGLGLREAGRKLLSRMNSVRLN